MGIVGASEPGPGHLRAKFAGAAPLPCRSIVGILLANIKIFDITDFKIIKRIRSMHTFRRQNLQKIQIQ